jgi:hypothetical protein
VARTLIVPSLAMAALWIFTTTPVFPSELVVPLSLAMVEKSTARLTGRTWADAVLKKTTEARANSALAIARRFLMDHFSYKD